jgi:hypothetical protein
MATLPDVEGIIFPKSAFAKEHPQCDHDSLSLNGLDYLNICDTSAEDHISTKALQQKRRISPCQSLVKAPFR